MDGWPFFMSAKNGWLLQMGDYGSGSKPNS